MLISPLFSYTFPLLRRVFHSRPLFSVESGLGAVATRTSSRFPSPLIEPDVRISRIRLSDRVHRQTHGGAAFRFLLRLAIQLPLKRPDLIWCFQAHHQSPHLGFFESAPEVRALPSTGVARLRRYYDPLRVPARPPSLARALKLNSARTGVPPLARITFPACRAHYPGGPNRCACRSLPGRCCLP
jgi:hypothetical protein